MKKFLIFLASIPAILIASIAAIYAAQDYFIFKPGHSAVGEAYLANFRLPEQELQIETYPTLRSYAVRSTQQSSVYQTYTFIFGDFHTDVYDYAQNAVELFSSTTVVLTSYPGFGNSAGSPDSKRLFQHQLAVFDLYTENSTLPCFLIGYGVGANVATYIASQRPDKVFGVVAIAPALGLREVLDYKFKVGKVFDFFKDRLSVNREIQGVHAHIPLYCVASELDEVIPFQLSVDYCSRWPGDVEALQLKGNAHTQLFTSDIAREINNFMMRHIEK